MAELLTVFAIVVILVAITIPIVGKVRSSASATKSKSSLGQLAHQYDFGLLNRTGGVESRQADSAVQLNPSRCACEIFQGIRSCFSNQNET